MDINLGIYRLLSSIPDSAYKSASILSLILTFVTLHLCAEIVYLFYPELLKFLKKNWQAVTLTGAGVTIHFIGAAVDNGYWGVAWSYHYLSHYATEYVMRFGVFQNIMFRQLCTIIAALCYIKAGHLVLNKDESGLKLRMLVSFTLGVIYVCVIQGMEN